MTVPVAMSSDMHSTRTRSRHDAYVRGLDKVEWRIWVGNQTHTNTYVTLSGTSAKREYMPDKSMRRLRNGVSTT